MRVLIDECMPWKIGRTLVGHECQGVVQAGFGGKKNGDLLALADEAGYDVLLTVDQGIPYQQRLQGRRISLIIIHATSNKIEVLRPHVPAVLEALNSISPGQVIWVGLTTS
jgi:predicted nuclease of predicted toxin-antitoxin system